jgi:predicted ATPase
MLGVHASSYTCLHLVEFTVAWQDLEHGLVPADWIFYAEVLAYDLLVMFLNHSAVALGRLGHLDQAVSRVDAALMEARRLSHPHTLAAALLFAWFVGSDVRLDPRLMLPYADELLALTTEHGFGHYQAWALIQRGWCLAVLGQADEGVRLLGSGLVGLRDSGFMAGYSFCVSLLADTCRLTGKWQAALEYLAEARRQAEKTGDRGTLAKTLRLRGDVLLSTGDPTAAEASYHEAIAIARQQGAKLWELGAAMSLARLWRDQGKRAEAQELLALVYGWFTEGFGTPVLQEAKALLDDLD